MKKIYKVEGMDCNACATMIELDLEDAGIKAKCSYPKETLVIEGSNNIDEGKLKNIIEKSGYSISDQA